MEDTQRTFVVAERPEFEIDDCRIKEEEGQLYRYVKDFLIAQNFGRNEAQETQQGGFGRIDVHVVDENRNKIGVEVKPYFIMIGAEAEAAFGEALLRKKRKDVKKMFVAFPMSDRKEDNERLINNLNNRFGEIWENLGLLEEKGEIGNFSIKEINKYIYDKVYSSLGIGILGIMGRVNENGKFQIERVQDP